MWSGEHPLGLLTAYANEGIEHWSGHGRFVKSWHGIPKRRILNDAVVSWALMNESRERELECNYNLNEFVLIAWNPTVMVLCWKLGIHSPNLTQGIAFLHGCTQYGHWDWIKACASAICGNCCSAEMWDWCNQHIARCLCCWTSLPCWNAHAMKHETCPSTRRAWLVRPMGNWMVCKRAMFVLCCDVWLQVVYLTSFVHAQYGSTPLLAAASNGYVKTAQLLMEKGANIEATDKVQW